MHAVTARVEAAVRASVLMVIDDDDDLRGEMVLLLRSSGHEVHDYSDARLAVEQLEAGVLPDLILLDLMMPNMTGWEFRIWQKQDPRWARIPVVAMSADTSPQAAAIDASAYLTKPFEPDCLLGAVDHALNLLEQEHLEARKRELERLSSLGMMAAGVAHEVNNPLMFVLGNLELAEKQCKDLSMRLNGPDAFSMIGIRQLLERANRGAERIALVVRGISLFATADTDDVVKVELTELIESTLQLVSNELRHVCRVERNLQALAITTNAGKLGQVLLNLLLNAIHAMREVGSRDHVLCIRVYAHNRHEVAVSIGDTGAGIPPALIQRVFDPFYSTKAPGVGMGLGLAISRELTQTLGGRLEVESQLGAGSTFRIFLPVGSAPEAVSIDVRPSAMAIPGVHGRPRVLVIDDEHMICKLLAASLSPHYDVVVHTDPFAALSCLLHSEEFQLILCDMSMPGLSGSDLYARAVAHTADIAQRFVFMTGGAFTESARTFLASSHRPQLRKPFRMEDLLQTIMAHLPTQH